MFGLKNNHQGPLAVQPRRHLAHRACRRGHDLAKTTEQELLLFDKHALEHFKGVELACWQAGPYPATIILPNLTN